MNPKQKSVSPHEKVNPHEQADRIFKEILPAKGMTVRDSQVELCHTMLDAMTHHKIALCDAGTGIGKTYSYLVAGIIKAKSEKIKSPVLISTSSIALQNALISEYIPFLSEALLEAGVIDEPLTAVVRKGKSRYVCDRRLDNRLRGIRVAHKNKQQRNALLSLEKVIDLDTVDSLSDYDKAQVQVESCIDCGYERCRYHCFIKQSHSPAYTFQICNHNLLIADAMHRSDGLRAILPDCCALIIDEAHKLPDAVKQMFCTQLVPQDITDALDGLRDEGLVLARDKLLGAYMQLSQSLDMNEFTTEVDTVRFPKTNGQQRLLNAARDETAKVFQVLKREMSRELAFKIKALRDTMNTLADADASYIRYAQRDEDDSIKLCTVPLNCERNLRKLLWNTCGSAVLTSGTLAVGNDFSRFKDAAGLRGLKSRIRESVFVSPFDYRNNCRLYIPNERLPMDMENVGEYYDNLAKILSEIVNATHGHTLVLFTSYTAMSEVYSRLLNARLPFKLFIMRRLADGAVERFKASGNGVLLGTGPLWEGMDFPGDLVSSLIIPRLPFAVPDAVSEAKRNSFLRFKDFLDRVVVPDMQIKLRQGFGRAIRTESDSCVVSILDERAAKGRRYHGAVMEALPQMPVVPSLAEVAQFIWERKSDEYFWESAK